MAIIATLIGGIFGFAGFLTATLAFDATFATACMIYLASGLTITAMIIAAAFIPIRKDRPEAQTTQSA